MNAVAKTLGLAPDHRETDFEAIIPAVQDADLKVGMSSFTDTARGGGGLRHLLRGRDAVGSHEQGVRRLRAARFAVRRQPGSATRRAG